MTEPDIQDLLRRYKAGDMTEEEAVHQIRSIPFEDMGFAEVDHHRELRQGFPEVIYAAGKTKEQVSSIMQSLCQRSRGNLMATRADREMYQFVHRRLPQVVYDETARMIYVDRDTSLDRDPSRPILILTAGTSDIPVAEEARLTAYLWGNCVKTCYDCGVAGIHRLFAHLPEIREARVIIVIAGMEGALASVVGGLTDKPVIAVPTSVGYGASFQGLAALLSMLNSCASGVSVMNIDNGFGAGVLASKINRMR
ncbi:nickel pincer cofactor biosynthesis protein LarB [Selenomonas montiformis]|uniref:Nickel pincer cofactor biosynthesis protein LarB n=1 Tax=Selenomonas montiformis TaxID=2652285 RepID=A0A6I2UPI1_9FIRM|nr:nickel pincer cofactor biosynthesis protein LarB [Selenomonas montiformis]MSV24103.1 nickel pincer cofactor biosynthesis protein LarB [Selenomonas montiformis]